MRVTVCALILIFSLRSDIDTLVSVNAVSVGCFLPGERIKTVSSLVSLTFHRHIKKFPEQCKKKKAFLHKIILDIIMRIPTCITSSKKI